MLFIQNILYNDDYMSAESNVDNINDINDINYELDEEAIPVSESKSDLTQSPKVDVTEDKQNECTSTNVAKKQQQKNKIKKKDKSSKIIEDIASSSGNTEDIKKILQSVKSLPRKEMMVLMQQLSRAGGLVDGNTDKPPETKTHDEAKKSLKKIIEEKKMERCSRNVITQQLHVR